MRRREFLAGLTAGAIASGAQATEALKAFEPARLLIIIPDIGPSTDPAMIEAAVQAIVTRELPANLVIRPSGADGGTSLTPDAALAQLLRSFAQAFPGLIEIVPWASGLGRMQPFQVARAATQARAALCAAIWGIGAEDVSAAAFRTIATDFDADPLSMADVQSAGFHNVLAIPRQTAPVGARLSGRGVLTLLGGNVLDPATVPVTMPLPNDDRQVILILPAGAISAAGKAALAPAIGRLADISQAQELSGQSIPVLTRELQMRTDAGFRQRIALHLFEPAAGDQAGAASIAAFRQKLDLSGIRYSTGEPVRKAAGGWSADDGYWIPLPPRSRRNTGPVPRSPLVRVRRGQDLDGSGWQSDTPLGPGCAVVFSTGRAGACGPDGTASLHVPVLASLQGIPSADRADLSSEDTISEGVILIAPEAVSTTAERNIVYRVLADLADGGGAEIVPLDRFALDRLPDDPLMPTFFRTELHRSMRSASVPPPQNDIDELRADALVAWRYFQLGTNNATGFCPSTTSGGSSATEFDSVTMWEAGSQFNAFMAALDLGLIDKDEFAQRSKAVLKTLRRVTRDGRLPPEWIDIARARGSRNFNSFDTGRLLLSLDRLRRHPLAPPDIETLVASWDFSKVIKDRRLYSIKSGKLVDDFGSNYTEYAARGLRAWGHDVSSPFAGIGGSVTADDQMALLYTVARIGPIGAEPALLELLDAGPSPTADYLADVLLAAQSDEYDRTGRLIYPSETPIDRPPWFAFQGYVVDKRDDAWAIKFDDQDAKYNTPAFKKAARANSTKAAYLWQALRPGAFSARLVRRTRAIARSKVGFLSAIYVEGEIPTAAYSDLNTNSVILQAIASMI